MPLPNCGCIGAFTKEEKLWAIYCALYQGITNPVNLPSCECVKSYTEFAKLDAIYCAILQLTAAVSGPIEPSQIEGITPFGEAMLTASPGNSVIPATDGTGVFTLLPYSEFGQEVLAVTPGDNTVIGYSGGILTGYAISDVGTNLLAMATPAENSMIGITTSDVVLQNNPSALAEFIAESGTIFSGGVNPVTEINVSNGLITGAS